MANDPSIACELAALTPDERRRRAQLEKKLLSSVSRLVERANGYEMLIDHQAFSTAELEQFMELEARCCPFLEFDHSAGADGLHLVITGSSLVKSFLEAQFSLAG